MKTYPESHQLWEEQPVVLVGGLGRVFSLYESQVPAGVWGAWCSRLWKPFIEACHRVRHLNTAVEPYKYQAGAWDKWCLPSEYSSGGYTDVTLYEVSRE